MLPPLKLLALDVTAFDADLKTWHGVQAAEPGFHATFSGMRESSPRAEPVLLELFQDCSATGPSSPAAGEGLPHPGKALPLEEPDIAWSLTGSPDAPRISDIPDLPGAPAADQANVPFAPPPAPMRAPLSPVAGASIPGEILAAAQAGAESGGGQATGRNGQATILDHIRYVIPDAGARVPAEVIPVEPAGEAGSPPLPHRNPSAIRDPGVLQQFVKPAADPVRAKAGGQTAMDAVQQSDVQDTRPAPFSGAPLPVVSTAATNASASPPQWVASQLHTAPGQPGFSAALGERVTWMTGNKLQNVELRLNPAELGPVRVQISIDDSNATVNFSAQHPLTRDAIEQALPRLREMLADQGLSLQNANVSEGRGEDQPAPGRHGDDVARLASERASPAPQADEGVVVPAARHAVGLVDLFA